MKAVYAAAMERLYLACIVVSAVALVAITLVIPYGVFMRYVMNNASSWPEPFSVLAPGALPAGWQTTSETYQGPGAGAADWHVGWLTPDGGYADLDQTTARCSQWSGSPRTADTRIWTRPLRTSGSSCPRRRRTPRRARR